MICGARGWGMVPTVGAITQSLMCSRENLMAGELCSRGDTVASRHEEQVLRFFLEICQSVGTLKSCGHKEAGEYWEILFYIANTETRGELYLSSWMDRLLGLAHEQPSLIYLGRSLPLRFCNAFHVPRFVAHATTRPSRNPFTVETTLPSARHPSSVTNLVLAKSIAASSSNAPTGVICRTVPSSRCSIKSSRVVQQRLGASCRRGCCINACPTKDY